MPLLPNVVFPAPFSAVAERPGDGSRGASAHRIIAAHGPPFNRRSATPALRTCPNRGMNPTATVTASLALNPKLRLGLSNDGLSDFGGAGGAGLNQSARHCFKNLFHIHVLGDEVADERDLGGVVGARLHGHVVDH